MGEGARWLVVVLIVIGAPMLLAGLRRAHGVMILGGLALLVWALALLGFNVVAELLS